MKNNKTYHFIQNISKEDFKKLLKKPTVDLYPKDSDNDLLFYIITYERYDLMVYVLQKFKLNFNFWEAFLACCTLQLKEPEKYCNLLLSDENIKSSIKKQFSRAPFELLFKEKKPELNELIISLIEEIMCNKDLLESIKWNLSLKDNLGKDILYYAAIFEKNELMRTLMTCVGQEISFKKISFDYWDAFQICFTRNLNNPNEGISIIFEKEEAQLKIKEALRESKFNLFYQIKNTKLLPRIISIIKTIEPINIKNDLLNEYQWQQQNIDTEKKETFSIETFKEKLKTVHDNKIMESLSKHIFLYALKFKRFDLMEDLFFFLYKTAPRNVNEENTHIDIKKEFKHALRSKSSSSDFRLHALCKYHKKAILEILRPNINCLDSAKSPNKLRKIHIFLNETQDEYSMDIKQCSERTLAISHLYYKKLIKKEKEFDKYLKNELQADLKIGLAQYLFMSLFQYNKNKLLEPLLCSIKNLQNEDRSINTGIWEAFQFYCISDKDEALPYINLLLKHDEPWILHKFAQSRFKLFFKERKIEIRSKLLGLIQKINLNYKSQESVISSQLSWMPSYNRFDNDEMMRENIHQYILKNETLYYLESGLKYPEELKFLKGKNWKDFNEEIQLYNPRTASPQDLKIIKLYTGHSPINLPSFKEIKLIEKNAHHDFFSWIKNADIVQIMEHFNMYQNLYDTYNLTTDFILSLHHYEQFNAINQVLKAINKEELNEKEKSVICNIFKFFIGNNTLRSIQCLQTILTLNRNFIVEKLKLEHLDFIKDIKNPYAKKEIIELIKKEPVSSSQEIQRYIDQYEQIDHFIKTATLSTSYIYKFLQPVTIEELKKLNKNLFFIQESNFFYWNKGYECPKKIELKEGKTWENFENELQLVDNREVFYIDLKVIKTYTDFKDYKKENFRNYFNNNRVYTKESLDTSWLTHIKEKFGQDIFFFMQEYNRDDLINYTISSIKKYHIKSIASDFIEKNNWITDFNEGFGKDLLFYLAEYDKTVLINTLFNKIVKHIKNNPLNDTQLTKIWEWFQQCSLSEHKSAKICFDFILQHYKSYIIDQLQASRLNLLIESENPEILEKIFSSIPYKILKENYKALFERACLLKNNPLITLLKKVPGIEMLKEDDYSLHKACALGDLKKIQALCKTGAILNHVDNQYHSPLDKVRNLKIIKPLLAMGFRPNKENGVFLFKEIYFLHHGEKIENSNLLQLSQPIQDEKNIKSSQLLPPSPMFSKKPLHISCLIKLFCTIKKEDHDVILKFLLDQTADMLLMEHILKKIDKNLLSNRQALFEELFFSPYMDLISHYFNIKIQQILKLENNKKLKNEYWVRFHQQVREALINNRIKQHQINQSPIAQKIELLLKDEIKSLNQLYVGHKEKFKRQLTITEYLKSNTIKQQKIIFIYEKEETVYSHPINQHLKELLLLLKEKQYKCLNINIVIMDSMEWQKHIDNQNHKELSASMILFSISADKNGYVNLGKTTMDGNSFLSKICYQNDCKEAQNEIQTQIVYLNVIDPYDKFKVTIEKGNHFAPWILVQKYKAELNDIQGCYFFDLIVHLYIQERKISDACRALARNTLSVSCFESHNILRINPNYFSKNKKTISKDMGTYLNFQPENLKRAIYYINLKPRVFSQKSIEFITLVQIFSTPYFKKSISFYNCSPYSSLPQDTTEVMKRINKDLHPWMLVASVNIEHQDGVEKIINYNEFYREDKCSKNKSHIDLTTLFNQIDTEIKYLTCCILFTSRDTTEKLPQNKNQFAYKNNSFISQSQMKAFYGCAAITITNDRDITDEFKTNFLSTFFENLKEKKCSLEKAFLLTEKKMTEDYDVFPMKMIKKPLDFIASRSLNRFFVNNEALTYMENQRIKEISTLKMLTNQINTQQLRNAMHNDFFGINSFMDDCGRTLLLQSLMRDLHETAKVLLEYDNIDVNTIDTMSGNTPLHIACAKFLPGIVKLLIDKGAHVNKLNFKGHSPLFYVYKFGKVLDKEKMKHLYTIYNLLKNAGANPSIEKFDTKSSPNPVNMMNMWKSREENYVKWLEEMNSQDLSQKIETNFFKWDPPRIIASEQEWNELFSKFLLNSKHYKKMGGVRRILICDFNPSMHSQIGEHLRYQAFEREIFQKIFQHEKKFEKIKQYFSIDFCSEWSEMTSLLEKNTYWLVYYAGHAGPNGLDGYSLNWKRSHSYEAFFNLLESNNQKLAAVIFNACNTLSIHERRKMAKYECADLIVGTYSVINDSEGAIFTFKFWKSLMTGSTVIQSALDAHLPNKYSILRNKSNNADNSQQCLLTPKEIQIDFCVDKNKFFSTIEYGESKKDTTDENKINYKL